MEQYARFREAAVNGEPRELAIYSDEHDVNVTLRTDGETGKELSLTVIVYGPGETHNKEQIARGFLSQVIKSSVTFATEYNECDSQPEDDIHRFTASLSNREAKTTLVDKYEFGFTELKKSIDNCSS